MRPSTYFSIAIFCVASVIGASVEEPDCRPPRSHHHKHVDSHCCADQPYAFSKSEEEIHEIMHKCFDEAGVKKHGHHGPPPAEGDAVPPPPPPFNDTVRDCVDQCLFKSLDLLTEDGEMKVDELKEMVAKSFIDDWASVGSAAAEKCLADAKSSVDESSQCKSGAHQALKCFGREVLLNCPAGKWTESDDCKAVKDRLIKCPNLPAPKPHPKKH